MLCNVRGNLPGLFPTASPRALLHRIAESRRHNPFCLAIREVGDLLTKSPSGLNLVEKYPTPHGLVSPAFGSRAGHRDIRRLRSLHRG